MREQLNYLNNLNRPSLVDLSLLQKINEGYQHSTPKISYLYSFIQTAGKATCSLAKDNLFITVIITCLILFLMWCYIEKQRQNAIYEKYLQKKLAKSLLNDELNLFTETPNPINIEKLFVDINDTMKVDEEEQPELEQQLELEQISYVQPPEIENIKSNLNPIISSGPNVHMTKREQNLQIYDANQRIPEHMKSEQMKPEQMKPKQNIPEQDQHSYPLAGNAASSKFMNINDFNGNYMLN